MRKPEKPRQDFPLFAHQNGQWAKKIRGKIHYFGKWEDPQGALSNYLSVANDLHAGRTPRKEQTEGLTILDVVNLFLATKLKAAEQMELRTESYKEYKRVANKLIRFVDAEMVAATLQPNDFAEMREAFAGQNLSPKTLLGEIVKLRSIWKWAFESGTIENPLPYQAALKAPPARQIRLAKADAPKKLFTAQQVRTLVESAEGFMKPAVLLAINCGFGNRDCCDLLWRHIEDEFVELVRNKTGIPRRAWLWPETRRALFAWRKESAESEYVCCGSQGQQLAENAATPISHLFDELAFISGVKLERGIG